MIHKTIIFFFLFSLSFTAAFALTEHLRLYVIASFILISYVIYQAFITMRMPKDYSVGTWLSTIFLVYLWIISVFFNNEKTIIYLIVYSFFYGIFFWAIFFVIARYKLSVFLKLNALAVLLVSFFVLFEFILNHYFLFDLQKFIPRIGPNPEATFLGIFRRAYGFSNEPTNLSAYLVVFGGLAIYFWYKIGSWLLPYGSLIVVASLFLTFSGSALGGLIVGLFFILIVCFPNFVLRPSKSISIFVFSFLIGAFLFNSTFVHEVAGKFALGDNFGSGRGKIWLYFLSAIVDNRFMPHGLGSASILGSFPINTYLLILYESGIFGLMLFLFFVGFPIIYLLRSILPRFDKLYLAFIYVASITQLGAFDTFYYPYTIVLIAFILHVSKNGYSCRNLAS